MNHGRLDVSTIHLCAKQWTFGLPRHLNWRTFRENPPKITEPTGRHFIHCIQHWIIRDPHNFQNRFRKFAIKELSQETILVDNHGQIYTVYADGGIQGDQGVYYFTIEPNASYAPLTLSQIDAVKKVRITYEEGMERLPSISRQFAELSHIIQEALLDMSRTVKIDPLSELGVFETVGTVTINPSTFQEDKKDQDESKRVLLRLPHNEIREIRQAYIDMQYLRQKCIDYKEDGRHILCTYLKEVMPKQCHRRIDSMDRTSLSRKLAKYYDITFPKASDKTLPKSQEKIQEELEEKAKRYTIGAMCVRYVY